MMKKNLLWCMFVGLFFVFLGIISPFKTVEAAPTVTLTLQVENPVGSGIYQDAGVERQARMACPPIFTPVLKLEKNR